MNLHILIVADPYGKPSFAPRLRFLCDYLSRKGHQIEVFTEQWDTLPFEHTYPIHEIPLMRGGGWAVKSVLSLVFNWKEKRFARTVIQQTEGKNYDLVFCTTFSTFPLTAAAMIASKHHLRLVADIRDLDEQVPGAQYQYHRQWYLRPFSRLYQRIQIRRRNQALKQAQHITTISPWHVDYINHHVLNDTMVPVHLIYNGFDPHQFYADDISTDVFRITYIGRLYDFQDLTPLRTAVAQLNLPEVRLCLHLPDKNYIPIDSVGDHIRRSSIMVVLTSQQAKGMMTTKFFEALGCEKPVLCIPSDKGLLAQTIRDTHAGIASDNIEEIKAFIMDKYTEWKQHGFTRQPVREGAKQAFDRNHQAHAFEDIFYSCIQ